MRQAERRLLASSPAHSRFRNRGKDEDFQSWSRVRGYPWVFHPQDREANTIPSTQENIGPATQRSGCFNLLCKARWRRPAAWPRLSAVTVVIVRGLGDIGSAVAHLLFREGYGVALHDEPRPATTRRGMAFADAAFDGEAELDGVRAVRADTAEEVALALAGRTAMLIGNRNPAWFWNDLHASCRRSAAAIAASGAEKVR
jgi:hypothetical protein